MPDELKELKATEHAGWCPRCGAGKERAYAHLDSCPHAPKENTTVTIRIAKSPERWVIDITFSDEAEALRARDAIGKLLLDMGHGTLCFWSDHDGD